MSFADWIEQQRAWSERTFGEGARHVGVCKHIEAELEEIRESPSDLTEWCDVILLALDGARREGYSGEQIVAALKAKQSKNCARTWPPTLSPDEPVFHTKSEE